MCHGIYEPLPTYPAHNAGATVAFAHHVSSTLAHTTSGQLATMFIAKLCGVLCKFFAFLWVFIDAVQGVLDKLIAVFEQIGAKLPAGARQIVQGVEIELRGKLTHNTVPLWWLADQRSHADLSPCVVEAHG